MTVLLEGLGEPGQFRRSCPTALRRNVLILFSVEKRLSASAVVMGVVIRMFKRAAVSDNIS